VKPLAAATHRTGVASDLGGFGAVFDLKAAGFKDPVLVAGTDGVGTKLMIATQMDRHNTIGIDLVAMCANDLVVQGAEPLFFLDYFATGKLVVAAGRDIISGIAEGCRRAGCALIGGETAEMPGMYKPGDYDLAGFCVGAVERNAILAGDAAESGDVVLGLASDGIHSNGFSLARKVVEVSGAGLHDPAPFDSERRLGDILLDPTRIYVKSCLAAIKAGDIKGLAHITGGGLLENIPRVLPSGLGVAVDAGQWSIPELFRWIASAGGVTPTEMIRTFNCGIGMVIIVASDSADTVRSVLENEGETVFQLGTVVEVAKVDPEVVVEGLEDAWRN